jgi:hypothetical protein
MSQLTPISCLPLIRQQRTLYPVFRVSATKLVCLPVQAYTPDKVAFNSCFFYEMCGVAFAAPLPNQYIMLPDVGIMLSRLVAYQPIKWRVHQGDLIPTFTKIGAVLVRSVEWRNPDVTLNEISIETVLEKIDAGNKVPMGSG